jgi:hypothetical protein
MKAKQVLDSIPTKEWLTAPNESFIDFDSGNAYRAFYLVEGNKTRCVRIAITEICEEDFLQNPANRITLANEIICTLGELRENIRHQTQQFEMEIDHVFLSPLR